MVDSKPLVLACAHVLVFSLWATLREIVHLISFKC